MKIAVVILNWNNQEFLEKFLPDLIKFSPEAELFIIDNASTDDSMRFVKETYPDISLIFLHKNFGYAGGYNRGLEKISEKKQFDLYVLLNSDVKVSENWLKSPVELFQKNENLAVCAPKILDFYKPDFFEYAGAAGGFLDFLAYPFCRGRIFSILEKDQGQYDQADQEIFWASGACFFVRSQIFHDFDGFDSDFFCHMEEIDFCWRIKNAGYSVFFDPKSKVYHCGAGSLTQENPKKTYLNFRNNLFLIYKNQINFLFFILFFRLILDGLAACYFLLKGKGGHFFAVIKAHFSFYQVIFSLQKKRDSCQKMIKIPNNKGRYSKSIIWNFFIIKKQKFYEI